MPIYELMNDHIRKIEETTFASAGVSERGDLQRLLREQIDIIAPDTLVIAEEFGEWEDSRRRIDLLGVDKDASLAVIELKRTEDGGHMELQAIRYAAMVSAMTFEDAVETFEKYLRKSGSDEVARQVLLDFLGWDEPNDDDFAQEVRIVLASGEFSKELTTSVMWLNERDLNITCMRLKPYRDGNRTLLDVQQIIPLPEAEEYRVRLRQKQEKERDARRSKRELTKYDVTIEDQTYEELPRKQAMLTVVTHLCKTGVTPEQVAKIVDWRRDLFRKVPGELNPQQFVAQAQQQERPFAPSKYFCAEDELIHSGGDTYALRSHWGNRTFKAISLLIEAFPDRDVACSPHGKQKWDESSFLTAISSKLGSELAALAKDLLDWSKSRVTRVWWGEGTVSASFVAIHEENGQKYHIFRLSDDGKVRIVLHSLREKDPFTEGRIDGLLDRLNEVPGLHFPPTAVDGQAHFDLQVFSDPAAMQAFKDVGEWMIQQIEGVPCAE